MRHWTYYPDADPDRLEGVYCTDRHIQHVEAVERLQALGLYQPAIDLFDQKGKVLVATPPIGAYFAPDKLEEHQAAVIQSFEEEWQATIYMGIETFTTFGRMISYLYVSRYLEEWTMEREDLLSGETMAYVWNCDMPDCSEAGYIRIRQNAAGSLDRIG